jgi:hypothetical protein
MKAKFREEIFREEVPNFRSINLDVSETGAVKIEAQDMGKVVEEMWGNSDYEFWVEIPESEVQGLLFALLKEKYAGLSGSVDEFREFCEQNNIKHRWDSWV